MVQQEISLMKLLKALWRFKWMIVILVLVAGGTAWKFTSTQPSVYEATATVMVESSQPKVTSLPAGLGTLLESAYPQDIASQIKLMQSQSVLERAVTQLVAEKAENPEYIQLEVSNLQGNLKVQQVTTNLVSVTVVSSDPFKAQKQANAVVEAYVSEANSSKQTAVETALKNTTKQLKEISATKVDVSLSSLLTPITAQIDTALLALSEAIEHLEKAGMQPAAKPLEGPMPVVGDAGTVLTPLQLDTIIQQVEITTDEVKELSSLTRQLKIQSIENSLAIRGDDIAVVESRTRALATKLEGLFAAVKVVQQVEIDPLVQSQLPSVEEQLRVASATTKAILDQVLALYPVTEQLQQAYATDPIPEQTVARYRETGENLLFRVVQHTNLLVTASEEALRQLRQIQPRTDTLKQWKLQSLINILSERLIGGAGSVTDILNTYSKELRPLAPGQGVLLTHEELANIENGTRVVATNLAFLLSEVEKLQLNQLDPTVYTEMFRVREQLRIAHDAVKELPGQIATLNQGGGDGLSSQALNSLRQQLQLALLTINSNAFRVVDKAMFAFPVTNLFGHFRNVILAVVAALLFGVLIILVLQQLDGKVHDASQVTSYVRLPVLARVARIKGAGNPHLPSLLTVKSPQYLEAFRMLRTNLGLDSSRGQVLLISSPGKEEGKTTIAANLARAVALQGRKVLLIDGNLRKPDIAEAFGLTKADGLSEFLTGENELQDYIMQAEGIDILPAGSASTKSAEELSSPRMKALLEKARQAYDVVIVDSAPITGYADTRILAKEVDTVLLVLQVDASTLDLARDSKQALETIGVRVAGFVLNKAKSKESNACTYFS